MPTPCSACGRTSGMCEGCRGSWIRAAMCRAPDQARVCCELPVVEIDIDAIYRKRPDLVKRGGQPPGVPPQAA